MAAGSATTAVLLTPALGTKTNRPTVYVLQTYCIHFQRWASKTIFVNAVGCFCIALKTYSFK